MLDESKFAMVRDFSAGFHPNRMTLCGIAAPGIGMLPSAVKLVVAGELIAVARATRFSDEAEAKGLRFGWCGFELGGFEAASALGAPLEVMCVSSGNLLKSWQAPEIHRMVFRKIEEPITVWRYLELIKSGYSTTNLLQIAPVIQSHRVKYGDWRTCELLLPYVFRRSFSQAEVSESVSLLGKTQDIESYLKALIEQLVIEQREPSLIWPGPFDSEFPFDGDLFSG